MWACQIGESFGNHVRWSRQCSAIGQVSPGSPHMDEVLTLAYLPPEAGTVVPVLAAEPTYLIFRSTSCITSYPCLSLSSSLQCILATSGST